LYNQGAVVLKDLRWGLIPFWAKDEEIGYRMINARAETLKEKPSFRNSLKRKRCLVLADIFYEWQAAYAGCRIMPTEAGVALFEAGFNILCAA
jgi:putative SOS response-associated peptidase YedK